MRLVYALSLWCIISALPLFCCGEDKAISIGSRLELFTDSLMVASTEGAIRQVVQQPVPEEVVLVTNKPWEGNTCAYYTIFQDGDLYRMYYRGSHWDTTKKRATHPEFVCYAESTDGIHWTKPELGLVEFEGSSANNIVASGTGTHCFAAFKDTNPECPRDERYKAISRGTPKGLYIFQSPDGIHWKQMEKKAVITQGAFDSQNIAFWDSNRQEYVSYSRHFANKVRAIQRATSKDYRHWTTPVPLKYGEAPNHHLYTNAVRQYFRAPHIYVAWPTRFLPKEGSRVEPIFMSSRDGLNFHRWSDAVVPESAPKDRGGNRSNYMTRALVSLPSEPNQLSVYATEAYYTGPDSRVRRFTYRVDGFVAMEAGSQSGSFTTPPLMFEGSKLVLNHVTQSEGTLRVELQGLDGTPIPGFTAKDCRNVKGDSTATSVAWGSASLKELTGKPIRVHYQMKQSKLFSMQFRD